MATTAQSAIAPFSNGIGGTTHHYLWTYQGQQFSITYDVLGQGSPVLLLPAFSTVSTRAEMRGIAEQLAPHFQVVAMDWLGFGESARPPLDYGRSLYCQLLQDFIAAVFDQPVSVVAVGHAAGYAMQVAQQSWAKMVLIAPTWKGPLRVMGAPVSVATGVRNLVRSPGIGEALYSLNTAPAFLKFMYRQHVYVDADRLTPEFMQQKYEITQRPGARFAPAAFVTGGLDPMQDRQEFLSLGRSLLVPVMVVVGEQSPPQSKAEMEALAALPNIQSQWLPGSLGLHEEYAAEAGAIVLPFLMDK